MTAPLLVGAAGLWLLAAALALCARRTGGLHRHGGRSPRPAALAALVGGVGLLLSRQPLSAHAWAVGSSSGR